MYYPPAPKITDSKLKFQTYKHIFDSCKRNDNVRYDPLYFLVTQDASGVLVSLVPFKETENIVSFDTSDLRGNKLYYNGGSLRLHGVGVYNVDAGETILTGDPCWVYLKHLRNHSATTIEVINSEPISDPSTLNIPLAKFYLNESGKTYTRSKILWNGGDINLDTTFV